MPGDDVAVVAVSADTTPAAIEAPVALADGTALTDRLGSGVVLAVEGAGENQKVLVQFPNFGPKKLVIKFARLEKIFPDARRS